MYQLLFNNLTFDLSAIEMTSFTNYIDQIDIDYWEREYRYSIFDKKIPIPTLQSNFIILLNRKEVEELRFLIDCIHEDRILRPAEINYQIMPNWYIEIEVKTKKSELHVRIF